MLLDYMVDKYGIALEREDLRAIQSMIRGEKTADTSKSEWLSYL